MSVTTPTANFGFLTAHDEQLVRLGSLAERYFRDDPNTCVIKLRQFGEILAQLVAANTGLYLNPQEAQVDLLRRLKFERIIPREAGELFHHLRTIGNKATHANAGDYAEALTALKVARELGVWFHRTFGRDKKFSPGPFVAPPDPVAVTDQLRLELLRLRNDLEISKTEVEKARSMADEIARARLTAEERAMREAAERSVWEQLACEAEQAKQTLLQQLETLQATAKPRQTLELVEIAEHASNDIYLDEAATRGLIDQRLRERGWTADTEKIRYSNGVRPAKGQNMAVAEWPTTSGPADYAVFIGIECVAVIEAKRKHKNVSSVIDQAQRYARGFAVKEGITVTGGPWEGYKIPLGFATNGRPFLKQLETESGIWFRDFRKETNNRRALVDWPTPDGLRALLDMDREKAHATLKAMPIEVGFPLRPYQRRAIEAIEAALEADRRQMLVAMATGTGKTKLSIALMYRLLSSKRFRRICFVVDRSALGEQAAGEFRTTKVVTAKTFADIFGLKDLDTITPEPETKVHICTIQGLVKRVLFADSPSDAPPVDQYDLMVIDECHRGYLLDREMSDTELQFRSQEDYVSKYRRVLEHFDATKIGLTATPALHTAQIFGDPIFTYSYREAVVDGFLIDHEPPIRIETELSRAGIKFNRGEEVEILDTGSGKLDLIHAPDEVHFDVEEFNKQVITVEFNRVVAEALSEYIDPNLPGKTLIFAVSDAHADIVVDQLKKAMTMRYGDIEDNAVKKITGSVDRPGQQIRSYRNDALPKIAVTVDLLTTGIDVPRITNLVFIRRVNSRILYEQMLGRATRRCDEIGKETFKIFDAVDIYPHLQGLTAMRPVVVKPSISLTQLLTEFIAARDERHRELLRGQIVVKLRRRAKHLAQEARDAYLSEAGETPEQTIARVQNCGLPELSEWLSAKPKLGEILDWNPDVSGGRFLPISHHPDKIAEISRGYGLAARPEDFIDNFVTFIKTNIDKIDALTIVVQRPRELTRKHLRDLKLELDRLGYSETALRKAWQDVKNEDVAASIVGFIRQAAIGEPLVSYEDRVKSAVRRMLLKRSWSEPQRKWLKRIEEQILRELIVDRESIDQEPFRADGGFTRLNKVFDGRLEDILDDIKEEIWKKAA
jgi:type I restriction enzyme R subunit